MRLWDKRKIGRFCASARAGRTRRRGWDSPRSDADTVMSWHLQYPAFEHLVVRDDSTRPLAPRPRADDFRIVDSSIRQKMNSHFVTTMVYALWHVREQSTLEQRARGVHLPGLQK
jgi:hypothetical protein